MPALPATPLLKLAFDWAAVWHVDQQRKYPGVNVPYMSHIAGVAAILSRHGFAEPVVAAGALHDVLEQTLRNLLRVDVRDGRCHPVQVEDPRQLGVFDDVALLEAKRAFMSNRFSSIIAETVQV